MYPKRQFFWIHDMPKLMKRSAGHSQRGISIVELMVGLTVGLFLVGGAISMFVVNISNSKKLLVEARLNQDLRAAADLVARDLRRAGYWQNAIAGTITNGGLNTTRAEFDPVATGTNEITYLVSQNGLTTSTSTAAASDAFGFRLSSNKLQMKIGSSGYQDLTDPNIITINNFSISESAREIDIRDACETSCTTTTCPKITLRSYLIKIQGTSTSDASVTRVLQERVRVRNDKIEGNCPA